jgi:hypothetical protein
MYVHKWEHSRFGFLLGRISSFNIVASVSFPLIKVRVGTLKKGGVKTLNFRVLNINTSSGFVFGLTAVIQGQVVYFRSSNIRSVYIEKRCGNGNGVKSTIFCGILKITPAVVASCVKTYLDFII